ncbi:MAG: MBL fold metallo-hydrolase [Anaerolineales bacterium]|nr:MAG: MBL fold metallo-hydrolase [Anaerolineales bacterium]
MPKLVILGSANAVPDLMHENTHMALVGQEQSVLIDCVGNPLLRFQQAGIEVNHLTDIILTHFHPDHVSGVPSFLMNTWLLGRKRQIDIHGLGYVVERMEKILEFFDWTNWPKMYPVRFHPLSDQEMVTILETSEYRILSSLVHHLIPTIGLRVEFPQSGKVLAYSCDTEPCEEVVRLAADADVLLHEASGETIGHTSAAQAGKIATQARAKALYLIHYPTQEGKLQELVNEARTMYDGPVALAEDFLELSF